MQEINNKVSSVSEQLKPNGRKPAQSKSIHSYTTDNGGQVLYRNLQLCDGLPFNKGGTMKNIMRKILLLSLLLVLPACSEFAFLASGGSFAVNNNAYVKVYNGANMATIVTTKKDIKTHAYNYVVKPTYTYIVNPTNEYVVKPAVLSATKNTNTIQMAFGWEQEYITNTSGRIIPKEKPPVNDKEAY